MNNHYNGNIPEGSTIKIVVNDDPNLFDDCVANCDMKIEKDSLMLLKTTPISIERVDKITSNLFIINAYWQDCLVAKNGILFGSYSDI